MALPLTKEQYAYRAFAMAAPGLSEEQAGVFVSDIEEMITTAIARTCDEVAQSEWFWYLQTSANLFLSNGQAILPANFMLQTLQPGRGGRVSRLVNEGDSSFVQELIYLEHIQDLRRPHVGGRAFSYYALRGGNGGPGVIYAAEGDGTELTGSITILACAYQTFETLTSELEDQFLTVLATMVREKLR